MAYLVTADLRSGTARFPGVVLSVAEASDARVTALISAASDVVDRLCGDHFEPIAATTYVFDGPTPDGEGYGGRFLFLNRVIRACTQVQLIGIDGATYTTLPTTVYRVHSSETAPTTTETGPYFGQEGFNALELLSRGVDLALTLPSLGLMGTYTWPTWPRSVAVTGDWGHATTPELIAEATAWIVISIARTQQLPPGVTHFTSGGASFDVDTDVTDPIGVVAVRRAITVYGRGSFGIEAV